MLFSFRKYRKKVLVSGERQVGVLGKEKRISLVLFFALPSLRVELAGEELFFLL